ncbi:MAG TPA: hypothetical protein VHO29_05765 [Marmoricola sp.]|nr:hypothetical protein [Marmoricola sp.]
MRHTAAVIGVLAGTALMLSGCGGDGSPPAASPTETVTVTATPSTASTPASPVVEVHLFTYLQDHRGYRDASGTAEYDQGRDGRELEVHARQLQSLAGQSLTVYVGATRVGTMVVSSAGTAAGDWDSSRGDQVPTVGVDDRVHVRAGNGDVVLSGRFKVDTSD